MPSTATPDTPAKPTAASPVPAPAAPEAAVRVELIDNLQDLEAHVEAWQGLADAALEANSFLEPWMFLPAARAERPVKQLLFALVFVPDPGNRQRSLLAGFIPLERDRRYKGVPANLLRLFRYGNCFVGTPLLHRRHAREAFAAFLDWLAADPRGASVFELSQLPAEGPVHHLLVDLLRARGNLTYSTENFTRAFFQRRADAEAYLKDSLTADKRRDLNRKQRRLGEQGALEFRLLENEAEVDTWIDDFLRLEASGWKGEQKTALDSTPESREFFRSVARAGFRRGQLHLLGLFLAGKPIALRCNFVSGAGSFFFKPAYDETLSRFSPGVLLEVENIRRLHEHPTVRWMDSCTSPENTLLNTLWPERRAFHDLVIATGRGSGNLLISTLPLLRWVNRRLGRYQRPAE